MGRSLGGSRGQRVERRAWLRGAGVGGAGLIEAVAGSPRRRCGGRESKASQRYLQDKTLTMTQIPTGVSTGVHNSKLRNFFPGGYPSGMEWMLGSWKGN